MKEFYAQQIKERVKMKDICEMYGLRVNRNSRMPCPFHSGTDDNFSIRDDFGHCFVCGESVDVISFVQKMDGIGFDDACKKIDGLFGLGLNIGQKISLRELREVQNRSRQIEQERIKKQRKLEELTEKYENLQAYLEKLHDLCKQLKPKKGDKTACYTYRYILNQIEYVRYACDCAADDLYYHEIR